MVPDLLFVFNAISPFPFPLFHVPPIKIPKLVASSLFSQFENQPSPSPPPIHLTDPPPVLHGSTQFQNQRLERCFYVFYLYISKECKICYF
ncbi:hypothetical protein ES332_D06G209300v1 [Gossypium tomentosum]|uniref:Uncharacterized protein n=1 Tax=Gossypium tomentosum TaxID=34277 RepID=A0A5D2KNR1_GOSTO|nr:hypothetical protein ES332_D06G209300v1 [Gossypium tomentosum]TYH67743.1 hypothetical protein ES332_D06G209300v1 [Gossypium tomentosum]